VGKVNISLKDVPWDQLLDVILQQAQLRIAVTGNVVRVITMTAYNRELDERKRALALSQSLEPIIMAIIPVSYAKADEMKRMVYLRHYRNRTIF
jgi:type IV pilus assembly protein PilQ